MLGQLSADLRAILAGLAEASAPDGRPRYAPSTTSRLRRSIAARYFGQTIYELVHFVRIFGPTTEKSMIFVFTMEKPTPEAFKQLANHIDHKHVGSPVLLVLEDGVQCSRAADAFVVSFKRMPYLACFADFLITALGWDVFSRILDDQGADIKNQSNKLSSLLHHWLNQHLPMRQTLRKFQAMSEFSKMNPDMIADEQILSFWEHVNHGPSQLDDFRLYQSVVRGHGHFWAAEKLSTSNANLHEHVEDLDAEKISSHHEHIASFERMIGDEVAHERALNRIKMCPLKLLSDKELTKIASLLDVRGPDGQVLPQTSCRLQAFMPRQQYLSGKSKTTGQHLDYAMLAEDVAAFVDELDGLVHALLVAACDGLAKKNDQTHLRQKFRAQAGALGQPPKRVNRRGFAELRNGDAAMIAAAGSMLPDVQLLLGELKKLRTQFHSYSAAPHFFQRDEARFARVFEHIYGGQHG